MLCQCDCGEIKTVDLYSLSHGISKSCGRCREITNEGDYLRCTMKNGASFIFDFEDEDLVEAHTWSLAGGHVRTVINGKTVYLHRLIMNAEDGIQVDHINTDKLDNRRCNLRLATHGQNQRNKGLRSDNTSGYKGVCEDRKNKMYIAYINVDGRRTYLGSYKSKQAAGDAYDIACKDLHGEFSRTNRTIREGGKNEEILELVSA